MILLLIIMTLMTISVSADDYYGILGLKKGAKDDEIRKAYKKRQVELSPETNPGDEEKYMIYEKLERAHFVLTDPQRKQIYDHNGLVELKKQELAAHGKNTERAEVKIRVDLLEIYTGTEKK
jgi:DnaJ-class molecular chaperone